MHLPTELVVMVPLQWNLPVDQCCLKSETKGKEEGGNMSYISKYIIIGHMQHKSVHVRYIYIHAYLCSQ